MSYSVKGTSITMTRGDTFAADIMIYQPNGKPYELQEGDMILFTMKKSAKDLEPLVQKEVPISTMKLVLESEDTKNLEFGAYVYDVQLTKATGEVNTFITKSNLTLTEEVG